MTDNKKFIIGSRGSSLSLAYTNHVKNLLIKSNLQFDENLKPTQKKETLTTRDARAVERKKYGHRKARRSFQFSKR